MLSKNQKGFAHLGILIALVVLVVGGTGWYVWHTQHKTKVVATATTAKTIAKAKAPPANPYAGWQTITSSKLNNTNFKIPPTWVHRDVIDKTPPYEFIEVSVAPNTSLLAVANSGNTGVIELQTSTSTNTDAATPYTSTSNNKDTTTPTNTRQKITLNSVIGYKTTSKLKVTTLADENWFGRDLGTTFYGESYCFNKNSVTYCAIYHYENLPHTNPSYIHLSSIFELIVKSWVF